MMGVLSRPCPEPGSPLSPTGFAAIPARQHKPNRLPRPHTEARTEPDLLLTAVSVTADDLMPEKGKNAIRRVTDSEVVMLAVAEAMMNIASDREFLAVARKRLRDLFRSWPPSLAIERDGIGSQTRSSG